jgi:uncharacterized protein (UPF0335 family)
MTETIAGDQLLSIVQRVERVHEEKKEKEDDLRDIYAEARGNGFDPKIIKEIVKLRRQDKGDLEEQQAIIDAYLRAISEAERAHKRPKPHKDLGERFPGDAWIQS